MSMHRIDYGNGTNAPHSSRKVVRNLGSVALKNDKFFAGLGSKKLLPK
jgi:hypothetical protein